MIMQTPLRSNVKDNSFFNESKDDDSKSQAGMEDEEFIDNLILNSPLSNAIHRSPSLRKVRMRTLEQGQFTNLASTERMMRNTDSMLEDAVIADKLKRRLTSRREIGKSARRTIQDTSLSDFIKKSVMQEPLNALSVFHPTDDQLSKAVDMALKVFLDGVFVDINNDEMKGKARQIFQNALIREEFHKGDFICKQNDSGEKLFIIEEGIVQFMIDDRIVGEGHNGEAFGELSLVYGIPITASAKAITQSVMIWSLDKISFRKIQAFVAQRAMQASIVEEKNTQSDKKEALKEYRRKCSSLTDLQESLNTSFRSFTAHENDIDFSNLKWLHILGKGSFGSVFLVSLNDSKKEDDDDHTKYYALKCMSKTSIVKRHNEQRVLIEKNILQEVRSNFIISLLGTHQDESSLYFLTDFVQGGNLMSYMIESDVLSHEECIFFTANLVSALVHIHSKGFVHRDLKPENCLIGTDGYLKLCDFGMAKRLPSIVKLPNGGSEAVTLAFTMCGTPEFMAPEFVLSTGYTKGVDIWALGCMLVEMYIGKAPFEFGGDLKKTFREVCLIGMGRKRFNRPEKLQTQDMDDAGSFCESLLARVQDRIGCSGSTEELQKHQFYEKIDFKALNSKAIVPPYIPDVSNDMDLSHFKDEERLSMDSLQSYHGDKLWCQDF